MPRLAEVDAQCAASLALVPPRPELVDENLRGYVLLLSAHFQGFCRDLYAECSQVVASKVRTSLRLLVQAQFTTGLKLDHGNASSKNIKEDFGRFGFSLNLAAADPDNHLRLQHLSEMNEWRNAAAHHGPVPSQPLTRPRLQGWQGSCDGLATSIDSVMYNQLKLILRRRPW